MSVDTVLRPDIVNYKVVPQHNGRYRLRKLMLNNVNGNAITLAAASTSLAEFKIPAGTVFNPARTTLDYQLVCAGEANKAIWTFQDTIPEVASIQFGNASGVLLVDLQYANNYVAVARKIDTDQLSFHGTDVTAGLNPASDMSKNYFPPAVAVPAGNAYGLVAGTFAHALTQPEPQYAYSSPALGDNLLAARSIPLSAFTHTALAMDRDMIFGEEMYIRIQIAPSSKVVFTSTALADPAAGAAAVATQPLLQQISMRLAVQVDDQVEAYVRGKFQAGQMSFTFPYVYAWRTGTTQAGTASIQYQMTNQYGKKLKRILHTVLPATETLNVAFDHENMDGSKLDQYQTAIDSQPLQDDRLSCKQPVVNGARGMDDWRENKHLARGSALPNSAAYYLSWFHCDSFSNPKRESSVLVPEANILEGLDLAMPRTWSFTGTVAANLAHYTFAEFVREVHASPLGPTEIRVA
jgi:hypothetical protein